MMRAGHRLTEVLLSAWVLWVSGTGSVTVSERATSAYDTRAECIAYIEERYPGGHGSTLDGEGTI
jgi:hypothetical protein